MSYLVPLISALVFAAFHVLTLAYPLFIAHGQGEDQNFAVLVFDFPVVLLFHLLGRSAYTVFGSTSALDRVMVYVWFVCIGGTLMYAAMGYYVGVLLRALAVLIGRDKKSSAI